MLGIAPVGRGAEPILNYGTGDWPVKGLGNVRVRLRVSDKAPAVWAHVPWRGQDAKPEAIDNPQARGNARSHSVSVQDYGSGVALALAAA